MKNVVAFTMALTTLVLATAADADAQDRQCQRGRNGIGVRAGTPCVFRPSWYGWFGWDHPTEIIVKNGTAVVRADGSIYYSPKPGFRGTEYVRVRLRNQGDRTWLIFVE
jgi:hypothetical protein